MASGSSNTAMATAVCRHRAVSSIRAVDPAAAQIGDRHQDKRDPQIFELPPRIEERAAGDDQAKPVLSRNQEMQSEIDGKEEKKCRRAEYHDGRSITSSRNEQAVPHPVMRPTLKATALPGPDAHCRSFLDLRTRRAGCASIGKIASAISLWPKAPGADRPAWPRSVPAASPSSPAAGRHKRSRPAPRSCA